MLLAFQPCFTARFQWNKVTGPFAAVINTAQRLGWRHKRDLIFQMDSDDLIDLNAESPSFVKARVRESVARWRDSRIAKLSQISW